MNVEERLLEEGFVNHRSDEPYEDYWILETGIMPDLLVEQEGPGWRICRTPTGDEPRGEWVDVASGLDQKACVSAVEALLVEGGMSIAGR